MLKRSWANEVLTNYPQKLFINLSEILHKLKVKQGFKENFHIESTGCRVIAS